MAIPHLHQYQTPFSSPQSILGSPVQVSQSQPLPADLSEVAELDTRIRHGSETLSGPIRISAPVDLGRSTVSETVSTFAKENPAVSIELSCQTDTLIWWVRDLIWQCTLAT